MPTTSAVPTVRSNLVAAMDAATTVQVSHAWPGPAAEAEGIFLGTLEAEGGIASIKTGRQRRHERLRCEVICQTFTAAQTPADADDAEARVYVLLAVLEDVCANNPQLAGVGQWLEVVHHVLTVQPFERGWAARIVATVANTARLT